MRRRIPGFAPAVSMMACQAVSAGIGSAAATLKSSEGGFFTRSFTGTSAYSAKLPKTSPEDLVAFAQLGLGARSDLLDDAGEILPERQRHAVGAFRVVLVLADHPLYRIDARCADLHQRLAARDFGSSDFFELDPVRATEFMDAYGLHGVSSRLGAGMCQSGLVCAPSLWAAMRSPRYR